MRMQAWSLPVNGGCGPEGRFSHRIPHTASVFAHWVQHVAYGALAAFGTIRPMSLAPPFTALLALPWLWPFTAGPMSPVLPYLVSAGVAALLLVLWSRAAGRVVAGVATAWLVAALVSSLIALLQYFNLEAPLYPFVNIAEPGRAFGNLRQPNQLATLLVIGALALAWLVRQGRLARGHAVWMGALLMVALAATASRVGLVELLACGALLLGWAWRGGAIAGRRALAGVGAAVALYVLATLALPLLAQSAEGIAARSMVDRLQHAESTCGSRLILWSNVLDLIRQKPWTGWGWGELAYAHYITLYDGPRFCHILDNAHNLPLHLAVELGVPVAVLVCGLIAYLVWRGRPWAEQDPTRQLAWGVLLAIGLHSLVEYPLWYGPFQIAVALCFWMFWTMRSRPANADSYQERSEEALEAPVTARWRYAVAALMLAAVAYAGWDYHRISQIYLPYEQRSAWYQGDAMGHAKRSWLFAGAVRFAEVTTRPATRDNAAWMLPEALQALHFSPETRVITKVIESATLLGQDDLAVRHLARFKAAFPAEYRKWVDDNRRMLEGAQEQARDAAASASAASAVSG